MFLVAQTVPSRAKSLKRALRLMVSPSAVNSRWVGVAVAAEPLLALVEADIELEVVDPVLAPLPLAAHRAHDLLHLQGAGQRIADVVAVGLGEEIIDHAVADMLAVGAVIFPQQRCHRAPDVVDELEIFLRRHFGANLHRALDVGHQHRQRREIRAPALQQVADHQIAA